MLKTSEIQLALRASSLQLSPSEKSDVLARGWASFSKDYTLNLNDEHPGFRRAKRIGDQIRSAEKFRALSLWQPWAWLVAAGHKPIENRGFRPKNAVGTWIAIHAAKRIDAAGRVTIRNAFGIEPDVSSLGGIVGVARLTAIVPEGAASDDLQEHEARWFSGPYGWRFEDAVCLDVMIPCRGFQSLWHLKPDLCESLRRSVCG